MEGEYRKVNVLVTGEYSVGKTYLCWRLLNKIGYSYTTVGIGIRGCRIVEDEEIGKFNLLVVDISPGFLATRYFRYSTRVLIVVFDITKDANFVQAIGRRSDELLNDRKLNDIPVILVGNKCDCVAEREVSADRIRLVCDEMNMLYIEVSAKKNVNIDLLTQKILEMAKESF